MPPEVTSLYGRPCKAIRATRRAVAIAVKWKIPISAIYEHRSKKCNVLAPAALTKAMGRKPYTIPEEMRSDGLLRELAYLHSRVIVVLKKAEEEGNKQTFLACVREARANLELLGKLLGRLGAEKRVSVNMTNVTIDPETIERAQKVYLERHPEKAKPNGKEEAQADAGPGDDETTK